jgi:hypothetical protein
MTSTTATARSENRKGSNRSTSDVEVTVPTSRKAIVLTNLEGQ